ncbi:MAG: hypothetical protein AN485_23030, partial [Anabaena sp. MDT14b]
DLFGHAESAGDQGLRGNDRGHGGQTHQGHQSPVGGHHEKRVFHGLGLGQEQGALTKIVQGQARHDHAEPGQANRFFTKVAQIGVQRFATRDAQDHSPQNDEGGAGVVPHEAQGVVRADGQQNFGVVHDVGHPQHRDGGKPNQGDGAKELANARCAPLLHPKQAKQNHQREGNDGLFERGRDDLQAFHRRQHRDGRGDDPIAIKQAGAKDAHDQQHLAQLRFVFDRLRGPGQDRKS